MKKRLTYAQALEELEKLSAEIESGHTDPDDLLLKIKRSRELVNYCRGRLRETEEELSRLKKDPEP